MERLKHYIKHQPALLTIILTFISVGLLFVAKLFEVEPAPLFKWPRLILLALISFSVIKILNYLNWSERAGLTAPMSSWHSKWYLAMLPLLLIALISLTSANWAQVQFTPLALSAWLVSNFATGLFEEVLMRGLCFYTLLTAWGETKKGVFLAAFVQALIFGLAHLGNLYHMPIIDVIAQVIFATLIGFGFAGLVYLTKSLWPAIIVHSLINSTGTINDYLVAGGSEFQSPGVAGYVVIIVIFTVLSVIPGLLYLRACEPHIVKAH